MKLWKIFYIFEDSNELVYRFNSRNHYQRLIQLRYKFNNRVITIKSIKKDAQKPREIARNC